MQAAHRRRLAHRHGGRRDLQVGPQVWRPSGLRWPGHARQGRRLHLRTRDRGVPNLVLINRTRGRPRAYGHRIRSRARPRRAGQVGLRLGRRRRSRAANRVEPSQRIHALLPARVRGSFACLTRMDRTGEMAQAVRIVAVDYGPPRRLPPPTFAPGAGKVESDSAPRRYGAFASSTIGARHISSRVVSPSWTVCGWVSPCSSSDAASLGLSSVLSYVHRMVMTSPGETAGS